jgi:hypothetical protein
MANKVRLHRDRLAELAELLSQMQAFGLAYLAELRGEYWEIEITGC